MKLKRLKKTLLSGLMIGMVSSCVATTKPARPVMNVEVTPQGQYCFSEEDFITLDMYLLDLESY